MKDLVAFSHLYFGVGDTLNSTDEFGNFIVFK